MTAVVQPPGQLQMFPPPAVKARPPWRIHDAHGHVLGPAHNLTVATAVAVQVAADAGEAWLVAGDGSACHLTADGTVTPTDGWPRTVAVIAQRVTTPSTHGVPT